MAAKKVKLGHDGVQERFDRISGLMGFGENVAMNMEDKEAMLAGAQDQWEKSKGHRANQVGNFNKTAIAVA